MITLEASQAENESESGMPRRSIHETSQGLTSSSIAEMACKSHRVLNVSSDTDFNSS